jgi:hypothetical protein
MICSLNANKAALEAERDKLLAEKQKLEERCSTVDLT